MTAGSGGSVSWGEVEIRMVASAEFPNRFESLLAQRQVDFRPLAVGTLQLNVTKLCNQACVHCHVDASPRRREMMSDAVLEQCLKLLETNSRLGKLDVTGGAPELHPRFRELVRRARALGKHVMVRHNLTVTLDPHPLTKESLSYLPDFFAEQGVEVISSLPYYQEFFTDKQRGDGVFKKSIDSLKLLNAAGFGISGTGLELNLVYNPVGAFLPAPQESLEKDYKRELQTKFGIAFNRLFALTNMPIHRFKAQLVRAKTYEEYMEKLVLAFNPGAAEGVMCRTLLSVSHDGRIYDCDFNQMLDLQVEREGSRTVFEYREDDALRRRIRTGDHCFGCTAGSGSSCGGTTA